jgi:hypothetical protein
VYKEPPEYKVFKDRRDSKVSKAYKDLLGAMVAQVLKEPPEYKVFKEHRAFKEHRDIKGSKAFRVQLDCKDP